MRTGIWNTGKYKGYSQNPELQMQWFLDQAKAVRNKWQSQGRELTPGTYGEFVADIERPAEQYRGRYQERLKQAQQLLSGANTNFATTGSVSSNNVSPTGNPSGSTSQLSSALLAYLGERGQTPFSQQSGLMGRLIQSMPKPMQAKFAPQISATADPGVVEGTVTANVASGNPSPLGTSATQLAQQFLGVKYVWGGENPSGFDCSGLLQYTYGKLGVKIPRTSQEQWKAGQDVGRNPQPGDAVFFGTPDNVHHVGMYLGNGKFIQAPKTGDVVKISNLGDRKDWLGSRRYVKEG
jgi:cell wall-associated NlpC family hydrolase